MMMTAEPTYVEENFGVLTDDELYLDCVLVRPEAVKDEELEILRVWVPKFPLTKTSVISCARQEVKSYGPNGKYAHLVFDLRGTGESDGILGDQSYDLDLQAIEAWAKERFGSINFGFLGYPTIAEFASVNVWPLRAGAVLESYLYRGASGKAAASTVIYLCAYGNFTQWDEAICVALANAGYDVYGADPLRYLLHANISGRLTPAMMAEDIAEFIQMLPAPPILIGQPLAAGLVLNWASEVDRIPGVIAIGPAQAGLSPKHIFDNDNMLTFQLGRHISRIAPRPVALVVPKSRHQERVEKELGMLYECSQEPRRLEHDVEISADLLLELLKWINENQA
jgi:hypothetical protein